MKKIFTLLLTIMLFGICKNAKAQYVTIPDTNFVNWLKNYGYISAISGNQLDTTSTLITSSTTMINCYNSNINDLTGIQYFKSLHTLFCSNNKLTSLPVLPNSLLQLDVNDNQISNLSSLPNTLQTLSCSNNQLSSISLPAGLLYLSCSNNILVTLPSLPAGLTYLNCTKNLISSMPSLPAGLIHLICGFNHLSILPTLPSTLTELSFYYNSVTSVPTLPAGLTYLDCSNNPAILVLPTLPTGLTDLYCSLDTNLTSIPTLPANLNNLDCSSCPKINCLPDLKNVSYLYIGGTQINCLPNYGKLTNPYGIGVPLCGINNINGCNFYWNISGTVYADLNTSCSYNSTDVGLKNIKVELWKHGTLIQQQFTKNNGEYTFDVNVYDTFQIKIDTTNFPFYLSCPTQKVLNSIITATDSTDINMNFPMKCKVLINDVKAQNFSGGNHRPGRQANLILDANNYGYYNYTCNAPLAGKLKLFRVSGPAKFKASNYYSLVPTTITNDSVIWNVSNLNKIINLQISIDSTAQIGQTVCYKFMVVPNIPDANPNNNTIAVCYGITNSHDPNIKSVLPQGNLSASDSLLTYTIQFQNTGNDTAINIVVKDTLSSSIDVSTIKILSSSFTPFVQSFNNTIVFNFPNINLVDSTTNETLSHGFVTFSVKRFLGTNGLNVTNKAYIYFDLNPAVITNTIGNIICNTPIYSNSNQSICYNQFYSFNNHLLNSTGIYLDTLTNYVGCDSIIILNLTVLPIRSFSSNQSICSNQTYNFNGSILNTSGIYKDTLQNYLGCDSVVTLHLNVSQTSSATFSQHICSYQTYNFFGKNLNTTGVYKDTILNHVGCDSVITLHLSVYSPSASTISQTICSNSFYLFNNHSLHVSGAYFDTLINYAGCDSNITLNLNVLPITTSIINQSICSNQTYLFNNHLLNIAGTYYDTLISFNGCDSIITLQLLVKPTSTSIVHATTCAGTPFLFNGNSYSTAGTYVVHLINYVGCDSATTLILTVKPISTFTTNTSICAGQSYLFNGNNYSTTGTYVVNLTNYIGCDSIDTLNLIVNSFAIPTINISAFPSGTICSGASITFTITATNQGTTPIYIVLVNGVSIGQTISNVVTIPNLSNGDIVTVQLTHFPACTTVLPILSNSIVASVVTTIIPSINLSVTPIGAVNIGTNLTFMATTSTGGSSPQYDFKVNGNTIQNSSSSIFTTSSLNNGDVVSCVLTANNTCQTASSAISNNIIVQVNPTGIESINANEKMIVQPNPCNDCELIIGSFISTNQLQVTNVLGKVIVAQFEKTAKGYFINMFNQSAGLYFVRNTKTGQVVKFIKE